MNIIFDFGNVIVNLDREGAIERFRRLGFDVSNILSLTVQKGIFEQLELGLCTTEEWVEHILQRSHRQEATPEAVCQAWCSMLTDVPRRRLETLQQLGREHHLSLLSNTNQLHVDYSFDGHIRSQGFEPTELFEHLFLSHEMHLAKPGREIFEKVLEVSGYQPEDTLFIDDSQVNCDAFAALGVRTFCPQKPDEWLEYLGVIHNA